MPSYVVHDNDLVEVETSRRSVCGKWLLLIMRFVRSNTVTAESCVSAHCHRSTPDISVYRRPGARHVSCTIVTRGNGATYLQLNCL